jgi:uncharacterized protein YqeY
MSLQEKINEDLKRSMKERLEPALSTLRMLKSDIQYELTKTGSSSISDDQVLQIIKKNISKRRDTSQEYSKANRQDLAEKEDKEADFLHGFLPPSIPESELETVVLRVISEIGAKSPSDMGKVMGKVMLEFKGKNVEGSVVSALVKKNLTPS